MKTRDGWKRCDKKEPCPICGKADWCTVSPDEKFAVCMRVDSGAMRAVKNGGFLFLLKDNPVRMEVPVKQKRALVEPEALPDIMSAHEFDLEQDARGLGVS